MTGREIMGGGERDSVRGGSDREKYGVETMVNKMINKCNK